MNNNFMRPAGEILFAKITALPILDKQRAATEILKIDHKYSFWDDYRNTRMFPLMTRKDPGSTSSTDPLKMTISRSGSFDWAPYTPSTICRWFDDFVFPWMGMRSRLMALITEPGTANHEHIDCAPSELNTQQHKFRIVLQGKTDTLYWLTSKGRVYAPDVEEAFVMDGGWPHGMVNTGSQPKVTLAVGAPWIGNAVYGSDIEILQNRNEFMLPEKFDHLWQQKY